jgi:hypothetical protein
MRAILRAVFIVCLCCGVSATVWAQTDVPADWSHGTTLNGFAGVATDSSHSGPALGGAVGWEVTPGLAIEGSGSWLEFGHGTKAFSGSLKVRTRLFGRRTIDPFLQAGIGMYRASFGPGAQTVPSFYGRRMHASMRSDRLPVTFTDPTVVAGGGVNIFVNRHLAIRPDVEATVVLRDRRSHVVTIVAVHAVYHFENHPVTPAVGR